MLKKQLTLKDPLSFLGYDSDETEQKGNFGAVTSRAGVGKTAFLVQIAISSLLKDKDVLHISIQDPVDKVNLWYKELFLHLTGNQDNKETGLLWESLLKRRFIMTFETESFDFSKLLSRIDELQKNNIFTPQIIVIDGLSTDKLIHSELRSLKSYAVDNHLTIWFSVRTHRHQQDQPMALLHPETDAEKAVFDMLIQLLPHKDSIQVKRLSLNDDINNRPPLFIDPSTMMIRETPEA